MCSAENIWRALQKPHTSLALVRRNGLPTAGKTFDADYCREDGFATVGRSSFGIAASSALIPNSRTGGTPGLGWRCRPAGAVAYRLHGKLSVAAGARDRTSPLSKTPRLARDATNKKRPLRPLRGRRSLSTVEGKRKTAKPKTGSTLLSINHPDHRRGAVSCPLRDREMRGTLRSREGSARRAWLKLGPSMGSILPLGRRAGSRRAAGTCSSVSDQQCLAAVQALSGRRHGTTRIVLS